MNEELIKKWSGVLDYTDDITPKLSEFKRLYLAILMNNYEQYHLKNRHTNNEDILRVTIPQMRRNGGPLEKVEIQDQLWDIVSVESMDNNRKTYAINGDDVCIEYGNHSAFRETYLSNCWGERNGEWVWLPRWSVL